MIGDWKMKLVFCAAAFVAVATADGSNGMCNAPLQPFLQYGCNKDRPLANRICCHNHAWAENAGYFMEKHIKLFSKISPDGRTHTFYDSVCGLPLFIAPKVCGM